MATVVPKVFCYLFSVLEDIILSGFLMQFGNVSLAYFTAAISLHTFNSLVLRNRQSVAVYSVAILFGWIVAGVLCMLSLF